MFSSRFPPDRGDKLDDDFKGKPTAVLDRRVSAEKKPNSFQSGVVKEYPIDYVSETAVQLSILGITVQDVTTLAGDFGVTHGDSAGHRTRLRTYWSNQATGIVDNAVFKLKMKPKNWGKFVFP
ncbi:MAG: hypothetical protein WD072_07965 [Pirellulales bacterium]